MVRRVGWIDLRGSEVLSRNECIRLLAVHAGGVGRIGLIEDGRVIIEPVNYRMLDDEVLVQIGPGWKLEATDPPSIVSFEVDDVGMHVAWSVLVRGLARLTDDGVAARGRPRGAQPWVPEPGSSFVTIRPDVVSGRRFAPAGVGQLASATAGRELGAISLRVPVGIGRDATLRQAAQTMEQEQVSSVLLGDHPWWVVSEHDVVGALAAGLDPEDPAADVATRTPLWATTTTTLADAAAMIARHSVQHLVVIAADGEPVGVLSRREVLRQLLADRAPSTAAPQR